VKTSIVLRLTATVAAAVCTALAVGAATASANIIEMPTLTSAIHHQWHVWDHHVYQPVGAKPINPPSPPCPENGELPAPFSNCGLPEFPATTFPVPGNMAYYGGHVQVRPKEYLVLWGWGLKGAFPSNETCTPEKLVEGSSRQTLPCDPDGAGKYTADFVNQLGGTYWAGVQTQYYDTVAGKNVNITNPSNQLMGIWVDDGNTSIRNLPSTSASAAPGSGNTYTDLAAEAARAVQHFHITDLKDSNLIIAQPPNFSDPNALSTGYCAFHDYTLPNLEGGIYNGLPSGISYTNMPYALAINSGGSNVCGENAVNSGPAGKLDGFSIVLGHEIEETVTDPGAEDIVGSGVSGQTYYGGWYDTVDANEDGDKCAWVGEPLVETGLPEQPAVTPIPGALGDITGNAGGTFAVQSLWSNAALAGAGYCDGSGTTPTGG
jgi:serine protease